MSFPTDLVHFAAHEFAFPDAMDIAFLRWLDRVRQQAGVPFTITNDARPMGEMPLGASSKSLHKRGRAVDIRSRHWKAAEYWQVVRAVMELAATAPGTVELELVHSASDRHLHLGVDDRPESRHELILSGE